MVDGTASFYTRRLSVCRNWALWPDHLRVCAHMQYAAHSGRTGAGGGDGSAGVADLVRPPLISTPWGRAPARGLMDGSPAKDQQSGIGASGVGLFRRHRERRPGNQLAPAPA